MEATTESQPAPLKRLSLTENATILIVDDNPTNLGVLFDVLGTNRYKRLVARDGESALETAINKQPDLILLDILMPGISGYETCRRLQENEHTAHIPVIFMTALTDTVDKVKGLEIGAVDYITKPIQHEEALARINLHLSLCRLHERLRTKNKELEEKNRELSAKNAALLQKTRELRQSNLERNKFFNIMVRDIKAPLVSMLCGSEELKEGIDDLSLEKIRQLATDQWRTADSLFRLLENILTWSNIQLGHVRYDPKPNRLKPIIDEQFASLSKTASSKNIQIDNLVQEESEVFADAKMLESIVRIILSNAIKYSLKGGCVNAFQEIIGDRIEVAIADEGIGISSATLQKLFRVDSPESTRGTMGEPGTGLGLLICKEYIEINKGTIEVTSDEGKGTMVKLTLPIQPSS